MELMLDINNRNTNLVIASYSVLTFIIIGIIASYNLIIYSVIYTLDPGLDSIIVIVPAIGCIGLMFIIFSPILLIVHYTKCHGRKIFYAIFTIISAFAWPYILSIFGYVRSKIEDTNNICTLDSYSSLINPTCTKYGAMSVAYIAAVYTCITGIVVFMWSTCYLINKYKK